jgi:hypothetical protein
VALVLELGDLVRDRLRAEVHHDESAHAVTEMDHVARAKSDEYGVCRVVGPLDREKARDRPPGIDLPDLAAARMVEQDRVASVGGEIRIGEIGKRLRRCDSSRGVEIVRNESLLSGATM